MPQPTTPTICLNMIVRNEAHIVREVLDATAPYISSWVIVDTGSNDGTQELIRTHMAGLGIPGELHERPWVDFGHNRTEALTLAQGHADYIWVMDADDTIVGTVDFSELGADVYSLQIREGSLVYSRPQLFRDRLPVRYVGVVHEGAVWDGGDVAARLTGDYYIECRHLGDRNRDPQRYARDRDLLLAEVERNPDDSRSVFYLAQSCSLAGDSAAARKWYARRMEMGGWDEEVYCAMWGFAGEMRKLGEPWLDVQRALLQAWKFRPTRAEPLYAIALHYRIDQQYKQAYQAARRAVTIPFPERDSLLVHADVYAWRAGFELAICAYAIGKKAEASAVCGHLLTRTDIPDDDRQRIAGVADLSRR